MKPDDKNIKMYCGKHQMEEAVGICSSKQCE